jgi:hypothetical protein
MPICENVCVPIGSERRQAGYQDNDILHRDPPYPIVAGFDVEKHRRVRGEVKRDIVIQGTARMHRDASGGALRYDLRVSYLAKPRISYLRVLQ